MKRRRLSVRLTVAALLVAILYIPIPVAAAELPPDWMGGAVQTEVTRSYSVGEKPPYASVLPNRDCQPRQITTRRSGPSAEPPFFHTELKQDACVIDAPWGSIADNSIQRNGTGIYGGLEGARRALPIPRSSKVALLNYSGSVYGPYLSFMNNFDSALQTSVNTDGTVRHAIKSDAVEFQIKTVTGARVPVDAYSIAFSENGQWMIVSTIFEGVARINLNTYEVVVSDQKYNYLSYSTPNPATAIDNTGRYGLLNASIIDFEACKPSFVGSFASTGCKVRNNSTTFNSTAMSGATVASGRFIASGAVQLYTSKSTQTFQATMYTGAKPASLLPYLALGDSFASGEGAYQYKTITDTPDNTCHLSLRSYPYLISAQLQYNDAQSIACSGARINNINGLSLFSQATGKTASTDDDAILAGYLPGYRAQLAFIKKYKPAVVSVSVVGNDIGFGQIIQRCASPGTCYPTYEDRLELIRHINGQYDRLTAMYTELLTAGLQDSRLYAIGYPEIAKKDGNCAVNVRLNNDEIVFSNQIIGHINSVIERAAKQTGARYVDVSKAFYGSRMCETDSWKVAVNGLTAGNDAPKRFGGPLGRESYHPNALGHELLARAVMVQTNNLELPLIGAQLVANLPVDQDSPEMLNAPKINKPVSQVVAFEPLLNNSITDISAPQMAVSSAVFKPISPVRITLDNQVVKSTNSDASGSVFTPIGIPSGTNLGDQVLRIEGSTVAGETITVYQPIYVIATPDDFDGDGITNKNEPCLLVNGSLIDSDVDGVDDACDGAVTEPPVVVSTPTIPTIPAVSAVTTPPEPQRLTTPTAVRPVALAPLSDTRSPTDEPGYLAATPVANITKPATTNSPPSSVLGITSTPINKAFSTKTLNAFWASLVTTLALGIGLIVWYKRRNAVEITYYQQPNRQVPRGARKQ